MVMLGHYLRLLMIVWWVVFRGQTLFIAGQVGAWIIYRKKRVAPKILKGNDSIYKITLKKNGQNKKDNDFIYKITLKETDQTWCKYLHSMSC